LKPAIFDLFLAGFIGLLVEGAQCLQDLIQVLLGLDEFDGLNAL
jgi:hypothetical protein